MRSKLLAAAFFAGGLLLAGCASTGTYLSSSTIAVPSIEVPNQHGQPVNVRQATSGRWTVVFFFPKAHTPG